MTHADPTFAAVAARLDREPAYLISEPRRGDVMPALGERVRLPTWRAAVFGGTIVDPFTAETYFRVDYVDGGSALFSRRGLRRVIAAAQHAADKGPGR